MKKLLTLCALVLGLMGCTKKEETTNVIQQVTSSGGGSTNKRVFVTFDFYTGNLMAQVPGAANGLAAADSLCTSAASRAGLGGTYKAWLSMGTTNAIDRISDVGPWYLTDDTPMFSSKAKIIAANTGGSTSGLFRTEFGTAVDINQEVWTATTSSGTVTAGNQCTAWTSTAGQGAFGTAGIPVSNGAWTFSAGTTNCVAARPFYCFEQ